MPKFTPGPWNMYEGLDDYRHYDISGRKLDSNEFELICSVEGADACKPTPEDTANARLIAAAPDLYDACQDALNIAECNCGEACDGTCTRAILEAAIAKAEKSHDR